MTKNNIIAVVLTLFTVMFLSDFNLVKTIYLIPNGLWSVPLFGFYFLSVYYFLNAFATNKKTIQKVMFILFGGLGIFSLFYVGFAIWKINNGNIFLETEADFQVNIKNVFFWIVYQSYLTLFFLSSFKQLVTIDQK